LAVFALPVYFLNPTNCQIKWQKLDQFVKEISRTEEDQHVEHQEDEHKVFIGEGGQHWFA